MFCRDIPIELNFSHETPVRKYLFFVEECVFINRIQNLQKSCNRNTNLKEIFVMILVYALCAYT